jgi:RecJ-like exonuclease
MSTLGEMASVESRPLIDDEISRRLMDRIRELVDRLSAAKEKRRFILLRFHHDADGISGAFALSKVLGFQAYQQNSAVYTVKDAIRDLSNITHEENPLVLLLDFGMNKESVEGLKLLKAAGVELFLIDHHPPSKEAMDEAEFVLTPWEFSQGEDVSHYVAGYLCAEIARMMGADCEEYARIACAGDKSTILETGDREQKTALVLDYLAAHSGFGNNLRFYKNVLSKKELFDSMWLQADEKIDEAANNVPIKERKVGEVDVVELQLEQVIRKGEFPNRSKVTTRVFERMKRGGPLVVLGIGERTIIMRMNDDAVAKGIAANEIAQKIQESMPDFVESGGGHKKAGAIRVKKDFVDSVKEEIIRKLETGNPERNS